MYPPSDIGIINDCIGLLFLPIQRKFLSMFNIKSKDKYNSFFVAKINQIYSILRLQQAKMIQAWLQCPQIYAYLSKEDTSYDWACLSTAVINVVHVIQKALLHRNAPLCDDCNQQFDDKKYFITEDYSVDKLITSPH